MEQIKVKFNIDDKVYLQLGIDEDGDGPIMIVKGHETKIENGILYFTGRIHCNWFEGNVFQQETFQQDQLKKFSTEYKLELGPRN